jgi:hypothetical protein
MMQLLLDQRGNEIQITEGVVTAAAGNHGCGNEVMQLLLDRIGNKVHRRRGGQIARSLVVGKV